MMISQRGRRAYGVRGTPREPTEGRGYGADPRSLPARQLELQTRSRAHARRNRVPRIASARKRTTHRWNCRQNTCRREGRAKSQAPNQKIDAAKETASPSDSDKKVWRPSRHRCGRGGRVNTQWMFVAEGEHHGHRITFGNRKPGSIRATQAQIGLGGKSLVLRTAAMSSSGTSHVHNAWDPRLSARIQRAGREGRRRGPAQPVRRRRPTLAGDHRLAQRRRCGRVRRFDQRRR